MNCSSQNGFLCGATERPSPLVETQEWLSCYPLLCGYNLMRTLGVICVFEKVLF